MKTVSEFLENIGRRYPEPDLPDGCISEAAFIKARVPMVVACAHCEMTMACTPETQVDDYGKFFCTDCAEGLTTTESEDIKGHP